MTVPIEITGYDKGISNDFGLGVAESLMSRYLLEEYKEIVIPAASIAKIESSPHLRSRSGKNAFDGDMVATAWESRPASTTEGFGAVTVEFEETTQVAAIGIVPGRRLRPIHYVNSGRPKHVTVSADGHKVVAAALSDAPWSLFTLPTGLQIVPFPAPVTTVRLSLNIDEVYFGKKRRGAAVSEVVLFSKVPRSPLAVDFPTEPTTPAPAARTVVEKEQSPKPPQASPSTDRSGAPCACGVAPGRSTSASTLWRTMILLTGIDAY